MELREANTGAALEVLLRIFTDDADRKLPIAMTHLLMFDIDGTLTLTNDVDGRCYVQAMSEQLGVAIDDDWSHYRHVTDSGIAAELFDRHQRPCSQLPAVRERFVALLAQALAADPASCRPVYGANELLGRLRQTPGVAVGLATGGWGPSALAKLEHAGIDASRLAFASADDAETRTEIMALCHQRAVSLAGLERFTAVTYIGDGLWDAQAAMALGWRFIGVGCGRQADRLRAAGACQVLADFSDDEASVQALTWRQ